MKIYKRGAYRNHGRSCLVSQDLAKSPPLRYKRTSWDADLGEFHFWYIANERGSNYRYEFTFSAAELIWLLQSAVPQLDAPSRALGSGALASLRELLVPKESAKPQKFPLPTAQEKRIAAA